MQPSETRTSYSPGNARKVLVLFLALILAYAVIVLTGRQPAFAQNDTKTIGTVRVEST